MSFSLMPSVSLRYKTFHWITPLYHTSSLLLSSLRRRFTTLSWRNNTLTQSQWTYPNMLHERSSNLSEAKLLISIHHKRQFNRNKDQVKLFLLTSIIVWLQRDRVMHRKLKWWNLLTPFNRDNKKYYLSFKNSQILMLSLLWARTPYFHMCFWNEMYCWNTQLEVLSEWR